MRNTQILVYRTGFYLNLCTNIYQNIIINLIHSTPPMGTIEKHILLIMCPQLVDSGGPRRAAGGRY